MTIDSASRVHDDQRLLSARSVLEVGETADEGACRRAYEQLAHVWDPSRFDPDSAVHAKVVARRNELDKAILSILFPDLGATPGSSSSAADPSEHADDPSRSGMHSLPPLPAKEGARSEAAVANLESRSRPSGRWMAIASLAAGILSALTYQLFVFQVAAIVLGELALTHGRGARGRVGMAVAGIVLGGLYALLGVVSLVRSGRIAL